MNRDLSMTSIEAPACRKISTVASADEESITRIRSGWTDCRESAATNPCASFPAFSVGMQSAVFNFDPPATDEEIRAASLQFVRKLSGFTAPSKANTAAFDRAVDEVTRAASALVASLVTNAEPRRREIEAAKAKVRTAKRFGTA